MSRPNTIRKVLISAFLASGVVVDDSLDFICFEASRKLRLINALKAISPHTPVAREPKRWGEGGESATTVTIKT